MPPPNPEGDTHPEPTSTAGTSEQVIDRDQVVARHAHLETVRAQLAAHFVGIDEVIEELIEAVRVWYVLPQVLTRPVIINLWGMTGVGKTDLVRQFVRAIGYQERFAEVELHTSDSDYFSTSVADVFESHDIVDGQPAIVLFDEVQRFASRDDEGKPIRTSNFIDFWELLSDGKLARRRRTDIDYQLADMLFEIEERRSSKDKDEDSDGDSMDDRVGTWQGQRLKRALGLRMRLEDIARMRQEDIVRLIQKKKVDKSAYEPVDHSKTLIFISGNLDDAFTMASETTEADVDADIFHAFASKVTLVDIKRSLSRRFRPEQVARFGNVHILSKSLSKAHFEELIRREFARIALRTRERCGLTLSIDESIERLVYRNGVYPVQGVRPLFSSIGDIVESNLAFFVCDALMQRAVSIALSYDEANAALRARLEGGSLERPVDVERPFVGRLDKVRRRNVADVRANVCVHEAGHAAVYALEFGLATLQLTVRVASTETNGFSFSHEFHPTKTSLLRQVRVLLAGGIAEELVFGIDQTSTGRVADRRQATRIAIDHFRTYGFDPAFRAYYGLEDEYEMDRSRTDTAIEALLARLETETRTLLESNLAFVTNLAASLETAGMLDAAAVASIAAAHGVACRVESEHYLDVSGYREQLEQKRGS
ncbi:MAG: AAA family ATPase [Planctomycetes bacterium]|nr:AAA family ATPase [Planctomycetota bacterium]